MMCELEFHNKLCVELGSGMGGRKVTQQLVKLMDILSNPCSEFQGVKSPILVSNIYFAVR